jgi:uncharacterized protein (TIGR02270 family)
MLAHVVERHAEQVAKLWLQRAMFATSPSHTLRTLAEVDARIDAHLDGLRVAGRGGWDACRRQLEGADDDDGAEGELFVASVQAFESDEPARRAAVIERLTSPSVERALVSALGWLSYSRVASILAELLAAAPPLRRVAIAASAIHRRDLGAPLERALFDEDARVRARALRAAGELGRTELLPVVLDSMQSESGASRVDAAWAAALLGSPKASAVLREHAEEAGGVGEVGERATALAIQSMTYADARVWLEGLAEGDPKAERQAVFGAGIFGDVSFVPWLIEATAAPTLARAAGRAFSMIAGVDLVEARLAQKPVRRDAAEGPDPTIAVPSDRALPLPDTDRLRAYWAKHEPDFLRGTRYLRGRPAVGKYLEETLRDGRQSERAIAAIHITLRRPGTPLFEVRAPGFRQLEVEPLSRSARAD